MSTCEAESISVRGGEGGGEEPFHSRLSTAHDIGKPLEAPSSHFTQAMPLFLTPCVSRLLNPYMHTKYLIHQHPVIPQTVSLIQMCCFILCVCIF